MIEVRDIDVMMNFNLAAHASARMGVRTLLVRSNVHRKEKIIDEFELFRLLIN